MVISALAPTLIYAIDVVPHRISALWADVLRPVVRAWRPDSRGSRLLADEIGMLAVFRLCSWLLALWGNVCGPDRRLAGEALAGAGSVHVRWREPDAFGTAATSGYKGT
jgi:hypothetical protein